MTEATPSETVCCGIEIAARRVIFVFLRRDGTSLVDITGKLAQLKIDNADDPQQVRRFCRSAHAAFDRMGPERIAILGRKKKGHFASGGTTFKLEGLLQLYPRIDVAIVDPATLRQFAKDCRPAVAPRFAYQKNAYLLACYLAAEQGGTTAR